MTDQVWLEPGEEPERHGEVVHLPADRISNVPPPQPPKQPAEQQGYPWERPHQQRDILPKWLADRRHRNAAARWAPKYVAHRVAWHGIRLPFLYLPAALFKHLPTGLVRVVYHTWHWLAVREAAPIIRETIAAGDRVNYLKLEARRGERRRTRLLAGMAGLGAFVGAVLAVRLDGPVVWVPTTAVAAVVLIWIGRPKDKPLFQAAVVPAHVEKITPDIVYRALGSIGIPGINATVNKGERIDIICGRDRAGWSVGVQLPYGVTANDVIRKRQNLASGLRRPAGAVWPEQQPGGHAGDLLLYIGDKPMNDAHQDKWPLIRAGKTDIFQPFPFGTDPRGRNVDLTLMYSNVLTGGLPGAGKTMATRVALLAAALDPSCELRVHELAGKGDLRSFEPIAHRYTCGIDDMSIAKALNDLRDLDAELERRAAVLSRLDMHLIPENKVTRQVADLRQYRLHPIVAAISECQELFSHPNFGEEAGDLATGIIKRGRALAVMLLLDTQRPDARSLPTGIQVNAGIRFGLRLMDHDTNDRVLGSGAYKAGIRCTDFTDDDSGIGWFVAPPTPRIVRSYYIDLRDAEKVCKRALAARQAAGRITGDAADDFDDKPGRDVLADLLNVFTADEKGLHWETVADRLAARFPDRWRDATAAAVSAQARDIGVPSVDVKVSGLVLKGCRRADIELGGGS